MPARASAAALPATKASDRDAVVALADRTKRRLSAALVLAHALGAVDVFVFLLFVLPVPGDVSVSEAWLPNAVGLAVYAPLSALTGVWLGVRLARQGREALVAGRPLTEDERDSILRQPMRCTAMDAGLWAGAVVLFFAINLPISGVLAAHVALTIALGGVTTCTVAYLLTERLLRPVTALALAQGPPAEPVGPGVKGRLVIVWLTGTGVPVIGLMLVGIHVLVDGPGNGTRVGVSVVALSAIAVAVGLLTLIVTARSVSEPLTKLRRALGRVEGGDLSGEVEIDDGSEVGLLQSGFNSMASGLRERERLRDLFARHVGDEVADAALEEEPVLGGEVREVAVLFVDIVGSTTLAERSPPDRVVRLLNRFFGVVVEVVGEHGGWVNKFEGDAALCVFGAPSPQPDPAGSALSAGRDLAARLRRDVPEVDVGIGISAGPAVAGWMGAERRVEYTVVGDPVNEAARLCDLAKRRDQPILASQRILDRAGRHEARRWRLGDSEVLRGRTQPTRLAAPAG